MFDWYWPWTVVEETLVVVGTEETEETVVVGAPPVLNQQMVVPHVAHSGTAEGWGSSLLAVAAAWALELQVENKTVAYVGHTCLVELWLEFVAGVYVAFAEVLACRHLACHTLVALAVVVVGKL